MPVTIDSRRPHEQRLMAFRAMLKPDTLSEEFAKGFTERAAAVERDLEHHLTKFNEVMSSTRFTREGQVKEIAALSGSQLQEIAKAHAAARTKLTEQIDAARADALRRPASSEDPSVRYLRQMDVLDWYTAPPPRGMFSTILRTDASRSI